MKPGDLVKWSARGDEEEVFLITFLKFTHWGGLYGNFLFPDGSVRELGTWGVRRLEDETG
jgi:prepilin-type processing-associated H-X9-DG protein